MLASIIIPVKNGLPLLKKVINQLIIQKINGDYEIIIIDSGSTDGSVEYIKECEYKNSKIRLFQINPSDFSHGKTRNYGASKSNSKYLVFLTQDAIPVNNQWLIELLKPMEENEEIVGVFSRHIAHNNATIYTKRDLNLHFDNLSKYPTIKLDDSKRYEHDRRYKQLLHFYSDNSSAMRKKIWNEYPYPNVDFAEDQLWAKKIIEAGHSKGFADKSIVQHSHNFGLIESFQRSFDESRSFKKFFGYERCPSLFHFLSGTVYLSIRDLKYSYKKKGIIKSINDFFYIPLMHFYKMLGTYIGTKYYKNKFLYKIFSRDSKIKLNIQ